MRQVMVCSKVAFLAALAEAAFAFTPTASFGGLRLKRATPALTSSTPGSRVASRLSGVRMQLGLNDKQAQTALDEFKKDGKSLTLLQKEQLYLDACASWNVEKKQLMADDEFEDLKSDLTFEGSQVMLMSRKEIQFMVAQMRYNKGQPIMPDAEFEELRAELRKMGSLAVKHDAVSCKILDDGSKVCKADLFPDDGKNALLYSPALVLCALLFNEWAFWFKGWDPILSLVVGSPFIAVGTYVLTNYIYFQSPYITKTACPECNTPQNIYFGDVLFVDGGKPGILTDTKCVNKECGVNLQANRDTMRVEVIFDQN
jgi:hypothetical protein